jgi:hypothetical protein
VVATSEVVGCALLAGDQLFQVKKLVIGAGMDLVDLGRLEVDENSSGHVLASAVSGKKVLKALSPPPMVLSEVI